jgi:hypothetical protein
MELWEKQHAYIPRRFVWLKWSNMITSIAVEVVELAQLDHLSWQDPLGPRFCRWVAELGDGRHREPRQVSAVTAPSMRRCFNNNP